ncbi:WhiB family transcriptional regulator [Serinibacter arcticus]|uniref:Transcriptional regulator WhiB n=1 Tax=Serinibacter arcticus TaxID=1655435 RepID=A0A2U1ZZX1_9MICO|nr:WhiB family transcriptional regulator [Serinibacter arcticus]PWD52462.1 WhiB family transcriptional regulator [Serinibacter arcticus]
MPVTRQDESWAVRAACGGRAAQDPDAMFVQGAAQRDAREVCFACPVRLDCLVEAFEQEIAFGVWGGLTERERRAMRREREVGPEEWRERLAIDPVLRERFATERRLSVGAATPAADRRRA